MCYCFVHNATVCCCLQKGCDKAIDWYQSVKETQGSVEVTSYGQMNNIYQYGSYTIGSCRKSVHTSQSQVIHLDLTETDKSLPKKHYSLDDLSDLESKLVLITGRDSKESKEVQVFLQVSVCVHTCRLSCMSRLVFTPNSHYHISEFGVCEENSRCSHGIAATWKW